MVEQHVAVEHRGRVGIVYLNRPEHRNSYTPLMAKQLQQALVDLDADAGVSVIVVTGRGEHFGVGADLGLDWRDADAHSVESLTEPDQAPWKLATPIIAALNGDAIGVSLTWAMQADIRVVAENARLAFSFNRIGVIPDRNSLWLLPRLIGFGPAMDLLLTGRTIDGAEFTRLGAATHCVDAGDVLSTALALADQTAARCAPASLTATKRLMYEFLEDNDRLHAYNRERRTLNWIRTLGETVRGIAAFKERRDPDWGTTKHQRIPAELR
ncbi:enoyl-CoA hydratase [Amycolatopsis sp. WAC 04197]|uniref:enoyl-CoA hydratase/isomerase family protein n=1 Tax=Amycolatopsis sp. WAC 04197 TaxID=2203199 RepID=UPI000F782EC8|nr:enoyl-CoA hydratase-related protein [Amycolatopsis sp. WAC 04197]RSN45167.1 enoyl-CoA hydratase [Amycolatopsis sp. WAC 04197]